MKFVEQLMTGFGNGLCHSGRHKYRGTEGYRVCVRKGCPAPREVVRIVGAGPGASPTVPPMTNKMPAEPWDGDPDNTEVNIVTNRQKRLF